jgi:hypothetical protein
MGGEEAGGAWRRRIDAPDVSVRVTAHVREACRTIRLWTRHDRRHTVFTHKRQALWSSLAHDAESP